MEVRDNRLPQSSAFYPQSTLHPTKMFTTKNIAVFAAFVASVAALPTSTTNDETPSKVLSAPLSKRTDHYGVATYYYQGGAAGSCGNYHGDYDYIGALSEYW